MEGPKVQVTAVSRGIYALTGGTGFIGRYLAKSLEFRATEVRILSRRAIDLGTHPSSVRLFKGDLCDPGFEPRSFLEGVDVLFHCAGEAREEGAMRALHVQGTSRLASAAAGRVKRWVQLSSAGVYGPRREGRIDEGSALAPANSYEATKAESDAIVTRAAAEGGFEYVILRPSIVFGVDMPNDSLRQLVRVIDRGLFCFIGPGGAIAPYIPVEDVADALLLCGTRPEARDQVYNLSGNIRLEEFIGTIAQALGRASPRLHIPKWLATLIANTGGVIPGFPLTQGRIDALTSRAVYESSKIWRELGFSPAVPLERRLADFVRSLKAKRK
jgi:nucleoside-diphosphate-sugar epimerase